MISPDSEDSPKAKPYYRNSNSHCDMDMNSSFSDHQRQPFRSAKSVQQCRRFKRATDQHMYSVTLLYHPDLGKVVKHSSNAMKPFKDDILDDEATQKMKNILQQNFAIHSNRRAHRIVLRGDTTKRPLSNTVQQDEIEESMSRPPKSRRVKTRSDNSSVELLPQPSEPAQQSQEDPAGTGLAHRMISDKEFWERWLNNAFRAVQQVSCRIIAKEWIKLIHPKKQSTHPYNGRNFKTGIKEDPNCTKPAYWPKDVIHREPDHINKEERVKLLVHLLMNTPHREMSHSNQSRPSKEFNAAALKEALDQKSTERAAMELKRKMPIIDHIILVRSQMESFAEGGLPGDAFVSVPDYADLGRGSRNDVDSDEADAATEVITEQDDVMEDDVIVATPSDAPDRMDDDEPKSFTASFVSARSERQVRDTQRRIHDSEPRRSQSAAMIQGGPAVWPYGPQPSASEYDGHPAQVIQCSGSGQRMLGPEAMKFPNGLHVSSNHDMDVQMHGAYPPAAWHPIDGRVGMQGMYNDGGLMSPATMPEMSQHSFMNGQYGMMPPTSFCGVPPYFQQSPMDDRSYSCMPQPSQSHEQMMQAYFPR